MTDRCLNSACFVARLSSQRRVATKCFWTFLCRWRADRDLLEVGQCQSHCQSASVRQPCSCIYVSPPRLHGATLSLSGRPWYERDVFQPSHTALLRLVAFSLNCALQFDRNGLQSVLRISIWSLMQNKHWGARKSHNSVFVFATHALTHFISRHFRKVEHKLTSSVLDCFVYEMLPNLSINSMLFWSY